VTTKKKKKKKKQQKKNPVKRHALWGRKSRDKISLGGSLHRTKTHQKTNQKNMEK